MINFIIRYSGLFFALAGYVVCFASLLLTAIVVPSKIAAGIIIAGLIFITYEFSKLILTELKITKETPSTEDVVKILLKTSYETKLKAENLDPEDSNYFNNYTFLCDKIIAIQECVKMIEKPTWQELIDS